MPEYVRDVKSRAGILSKRRNCSHHKPHHRFAHECGHGCLEGTIDREDYDLSDFDEKAIQYYTVDGKR